MATDYNVYIENIKEAITVIRKYIEILKMLKEITNDLSSKGVLIENNKSYINNLQADVEDLNEKIAPIVGVTDQRIAELEEKVIEYANILDNTINLDEETDTTNIVTDNLQVSNMIIDSGTEDSALSFVARQTKFKFYATDDENLYLYTGDGVERMRIYAEHGAEGITNIRLLKGQDGYIELDMETDNIGVFYDDNIYQKTFYLSSSGVSGSYRDYNTNYTSSFNLNIENDNLDFTLTNGDVLEFTDEGFYVSSSVRSNNFYFGSFGELTVPSYQPVFTSTGAITIDRALLNNLLYVGQFRDNNNRVFRLSYDDQGTSVMFTNLDEAQDGIYYRAYKINVVDLSVERHEFKIFSI